MKFGLGFDGVVITYSEQHDIHCRSLFLVNNSRYDCTNTRTWKL